jgi:hypothetical protein
MPQILPLRALGCLLMVAISVLAFGTPRLSAAERADVGVSRCERADLDPGRGTPCIAAQADRFELDDNDELTRSSPAREALFPSPAPPAAVANDRSRPDVARDWTAPRMPTGPPPAR